MEEKHTDDDMMSDARLSELLSQLSKEPTPEAHFEERFLSVFHDRVMQEAVCKPSRARLWEHLACFFSSVHKGRLALASTYLVAFGAFTFMLSNWVFNSDSAAATANRDRVKRGMIESFEALNINASLFNSKEKQSDFASKFMSVDHEKECLKKIFPQEEKCDVYYDGELNDAHTVEGTEMLQLKH